MKSNLFHLFAWGVLILGVAIEAQIMEKPTEETVAEFEAAEYPSVAVLDHAIEDQIEVVKQLKLDSQSIQERMKNNPQVGYWKDRAGDAVELHFRGVRVLKLLKDLREKEVTA